MSNFKQQNTNNELIVTDMDQDWFDLKQLVQLTGQSKEDFDIVILKEALDNAIDAAEAAKTPPQITLHINPNNRLATIIDNGIGLDETAIIKLLNFKARVSSKDAKLTTSRGQQGIAFKGLVGIPVAFQRAEDRNQEKYLALEIKSRNKCYTIFVGSKKRQKLRAWLEINHGQSDPSLLQNLPKTVFLIKLHNVSDYSHLIGAYAALNPHLSITYSVDREILFKREAIDQSWKPNTGTSALWYTSTDFGKYFEGYKQINNSLIHFVRNFKGFSSTEKAKEIIELLGLPAKKRIRLQEINEVTEDRLLKILRKKTAEKIKKPDDPRKEPENPDKRAIHLSGKNTFISALLNGIDGKVHYGKKFGTFDRKGGEKIPFHIEMALIPEGNMENNFSSAINYSPSYVNFWENEILRDEKGQIAYLVNILGNYSPSEQSKQAKLFSHLICPNLTFKEKGKSIIDVPHEVKITFCELLNKLGKLYRDEWKGKNTKKVKSDKLNYKDAAFQVMEEAYKAAAGTFKFAYARQIMYKARPKILKLTDGENLEKRQVFYAEIIANLFERKPPFNRKLACIL